ncbi:MAG: ABC transporter permease [Gemmatimonadales bacterium]
MPSVGRKLLRRLRALVRRRRLDDELDDELAFHLAMEVERYLADGLEPAEARRRARLAFGAVQDHREATRDARGLGALDDLLRDLRHGARGLRRRPGYAVVVLLTLGAGVGGSAAIYGAVDGILLTPLPYPAPERVMGIWQTDLAKGLERLEPSPANFLDLRDRTRSFRSLTAMEPFGFDLQGDEGPIYLPSWLVYRDFFETFGMRPSLGRLPRPDEYDEGATPVVVLGHGAWQRWFGADSGVIGRAYQMDGLARTVVAVMPPEFAMPRADVVWAPKLVTGWERQARSNTFYTVFGRLADHATPETAAAELETLAASLRLEHPRINAGLGLVAVPLPIQVVGEARDAMLLLLGAVGLVLLVVMANVGSLQLARAAGRAREFALRGALGAGRRRVIRQLVTENLLLAGLATVLGFAVARAALAGIRSLAPAGFPRLDQLTADGHVLLFAGLVSAIVVLSAGVWPARVATGIRLHDSMGSGGRTTGGPRLGRAHGGLVVLQVGFSLVLLIGAGLLTRSFLTLLREDRGFRVAGTVTFTVQSWSYYDAPAARVRFVGEVLDRLRSTPGVRAAGMLSAVPLAASIGAEHTALAVDGLEATEPNGAQRQVHYVAATPGALEALAVPVTAGRGLEARDRADALPVALVNQAFVARYFGELDPIGKRIAVGVLRGGTPPTRREIVGVVGDVRRLALSEAPLPTVYLPLAQAPTGANAFVIRGEGDPMALLTAGKRILHAVNPAIPVYHEATMAELVGASVQDRSFLLAILAGFATLALGLAAAGLFGLMSYRISDRTREIGVRMAFGAGRGRVLAMVLRQGAALAATGIALGLAGSVAVTHSLASRLYRVAPLDPTTFGLAALVLLATALLATWYPAWRASTIDPIRALGSD